MTMLDAANSSVNAAPLSIPTSSLVTTGVTAGAVVGVAARNAAPPPDRVVQERVDQTVGATEHLGDPAYVIEGTMNDPSLSQAQKDEYIAQLVELSQA
jgi:hypothetical protein